MLCIAFSQQDISTGNAYLKKPFLEMLITLNFVHRIVTLHDVYMQSFVFLACINHVICGGIYNHRVTLCEPLNPDFLFYF